ncbi:hypothetical protein RND81_12G210900 [Saponaria officinalis]|uniref:Uncharacterized protein n=1 Tax=Saponaria officinalis TaxID=3572 RepID=A0AAW1HDL2_SAPOF
MNLYSPKLSKYSTPYIRTVLNSIRAFKSIDEIKQELGCFYSHAVQDGGPNQLWVSRVCSLVSIGPGRRGRSSTAYISTVGFEFCFEAQLYYNDHSPFDNPDVNLAWEWQRCNEITFPVGCDHATMLPSQPFNLTRFKRGCESRFGISPNLNFMEKFFGNKNIKEILKHKGSNIIFSDGFRDPLSTSAITEDLSDSILAINTMEGTKELDFGFGVEDTAVVKRAKRERKEDNYSMDC